ncbi:MAG: potassium transporter TrkA [Methanomicrobiales archaeon HGW-Methanomicrobiales-1]|jgi:Trk K+ transport system NAD-binding subunit|nr:MAG: potassium transporter TrkA [Methanomicrobiales archaeon HGW-Methanomicrobiales-1]
MAHTKRGQVWRVIRNSPGIQITIYFLAFAMLIALYTYIFYTVYPVFENKPISWPDALLFVVESMTTVGYGWLLPFTNDYTTFLTIQIMLSGVIMIFVVIPLLLAPFLTVLLAPAPPRKTPHMLSGHTVVMGYDELTRSVIDSLTISEHDILIIEQDRTTALEIATYYRKRAYVIWGDYNDPGTWAAAHIDKAKNIVICKDERQTASIVLGIREQVKGKIISIVDKLSFERYLRYAGADYVLSPKHATGRILARHAVLNPSGDAEPDIPGLDRININLEHKAEQELRLINIPVVFGCRAAFKSLTGLQLFERFGIIVPFLWKAGKFIPEPGHDIIVDNTTSLFLFGRAESIVTAIREEFDINGCADAFAVIAGFGDVGSGAYQELQASGVSCIVVDSKQQGVEQVVGNAEDEAVLKEARIEEARFCVVALNDDDVNIFTTLMARNLNPVIRILARANEPATVEKLYRAGADYVALLPMIGGQTIARIILAETATILLELPNNDLVILKHAHKNYSKPLKWFTRKTGVRIIGIESPNRSIIAPSPEEIILEGDALIAVGDTEQLKKFIHLV